MPKLHGVNVEAMSVVELQALALDVAAELDKRDEDDPVYWAGYDAGSEEGAADAADCYREWSGC